VWSGTVPAQQQQQQQQHKVKNWFFTDFVIDQLFRDM